LPFKIFGLSGGQVLHFVSVGVVNNSFIALVYEANVRELETPALQILTRDKSPGPSLEIPNG